jgi:hypothetical protein
MMMSKGKNRKGGKNTPNNNPPKGNDNDKNSNKCQSDNSHVVANVNTNDKQDGYKGPRCNGKGGFTQEVM